MPSPVKMTCAVPGCGHAVDFNKPPYGQWEEMQAHLTDVHIPKEGRMGKIYDQLWEKLDGYTSQALSSTLDKNSVEYAKQVAAGRGVAESLFLFSHAGDSTRFPTVDSIIRHSVDRVRGGITEPVLPAQLYTNAKQAVASAPATQDSAPVQPETPAVANPAPQSKSALSDEQKVAIHNALNAGLTADQLATSFKVPVTEIEALK